MPSPPTGSTQIRIPPMRSSLRLRNASVLRPASSPGRHSPTRSPIRTWSPATGSDGSSSFSRAYFRMDCCRRAGPSTASESIKPARSSSIRQRRNRLNAAGGRGAYLVRATARPHFEPGRPIRYTVAVSHVAHNGERFDLLAKSTHAAWYAVTVDGSRAPIYSRDPYGP